MILGDHNVPKPPSFYILRISFRIFVVGELRDFKFGRQIDHIKSQPKEDKRSLKGALSHHVTNFKFLLLLKYLWNG